MPRVRTQPVQVEPAEGAGRAVDPIGPLRNWFTGLGYTAWPFQEAAWAAQSRGESGLIHVPTGAGKTYAAYLAPLASLIERPGTGLRILFITPLRAVSRDIALALTAPVEALGLLGTPIAVETRTGDTSSSVRARQRSKLPQVLVTTPESLTLLLSQTDAAKKFANLHAVIVDEWHELLSSKRGTQTELALARLRTLSPTMTTWALSATLANLDEAAQAAVGVGAKPTLVSARIDRPVVIETLLPRKGDPFPWAGHLGLSMLDRVAEAIDPSHSTLVFTNTRSQAERWFHALSLVRPAWTTFMALHHGSIDRAERERVEAGLKDGSVRVVVATSSLDLGVDFAPVERVMQIGSPKGIARLVQRAGRASHRPGAPCHIVCVPTHALEMVEVAAVRRALAAGELESRTPEDKPIDVLTQHIVTRGLGGGFTVDELFDEVRSAYSYRNLTREEFNWALKTVSEGGETLGAYPEYHRVQPADDGRMGVPDKRIAHLHRLNIGTITGDGTVDIRFVNGRRIGSIEENFVQKLRAGETFVFAGRVLSFVRLHDMTAFVRPATGTSNHTPIWSGTRLPISESLSIAVREALESARDALGRDEPASEPELNAAAHLIATQARLSAVPAAGETLIETGTTREGHHLFVYPFEGRLVHGGLAALLALRLSRHREVTFTVAANDYGFELLAPEVFPYEEMITDELFTLEGLAADAVESVNLSAMAKAQFREVARVSGLVFQSYPGSRRSTRQLHTRAGLIYDVFEQFDPDNLLLHQARREVLEKRFEQSRLGRTLVRLRDMPRVVRTIERPTPLSLPLIVERIGGRLSSESVAKRVERMSKGWTA